MNKYFGETAIFRDPPLRDEDADQGPLGLFVRLAQTETLKERTRRPVSRQGAGQGSKIFAPGRANRILQLEARGDVLTSTS